MIKLQNNSTNEQNFNEFPIEVFPKEIRRVIYELNKCSLFPIPYTSLAILVATSIGIGKRSKAKMKYEVSANLYGAICAPRGSNKSHPVKFILKPFQKYDSIAFENYKKEQKDDPQIFHILDQYIVSDITIEKLQVRLASQDKGLLYYCDELEGLFKNIDKYGGNNSSFFLSAFDNGPINVDRIGRNAVYSEDSFLSIIGTIQPRVFKDTSMLMINNGFLDRFLIIFSDNLNKPHLSQYELPNDIELIWENTIQKLIEKGLPRTLKFNREAIDEYAKWHYDMTNYCNSVNDQFIPGIFAKLEKYILIMAKNLFIKFFLKVK